jgi:hypothetical protein
MHHKKFYLFVLTSLCLALGLLALPEGAGAQGRYANQYSKRDVSNIIAKLEQSSNTFRQEFDRNLDQSSLNGTNEEDRINRIVGDYENSLDRLRRDYDRFDTWWQSRNNVQDVMRNARPVNAMMTSLPFARRLERQWNNMRRDLNKLADTYDLPDLAGGGGNWGGGGGGGGGNANVPNWAVGTFYGRNPQNGGTITLTISRNGSITADFQGDASYGNWYGNSRININGAEARVTRLNNGIRTVRTDNGERIDYYRTNPGDGGDWNNGGGGGGNPVNWAVGNFNARNPQTGGTITLSIQNNGNVTVYMDGATNYGTMDGSILVINGVRSRVTRRNNGISTTREDNGEVINYRRQ